MTRGFTLEKTRKASSDFFMISLLVLLVGIGLTALFSSSYFYGDYRFQDPFYFLKRQAVWIALGVVAAFVLSRISLELVRKTIPFLLVGTIVLMLLVFIPGLGQEIMGGRRWFFVFGVSIQPAELVKLVLVLYMANAFAKKEERINDIQNTLLPIVIVGGVLILLVYVQNDYSTFIYMALLALIMLFIARVRVLYFLAFGTVAVPLALLLLFTREQRVRRLLTFFNPEADIFGTGYQLHASQAALLGGGVFGRGIGLGTRKLGGLPFAHSDFIFSIVGEELGFIGVTFVILLFCAFAVRGFQIAHRSKDRFSYYLAFGLTASIAVQAFFNMAVVCGLIPVTGVTLPFFSAGGSSILITLMMCGLLLNVSRRGTGEPVNG